MASLFLPKKAVFSCSSRHGKIISLCPSDKAMLFLCGWKKRWCEEAVCRPPPIAELVQVVWAHFIFI